jgi:hypothetical protein
MATSAVTNVGLRQTKTSLMTHKTARTLHTLDRLYFCESSYRTGLTVHVPEARADTSWTFEVRAGDAAGLYFVIAHAVPQYTGDLS